MSCKVVQSKISAYVDGELTGLEMMEIRSHLCDCRGCDEEVESYRRVKLLLGTMPEQDPGEDFEARLVQRVFAAVGEEPKQKRRASYAWAAGFAFAAAFFGGFVYLENTKKEVATVQEIHKVTNSEMSRDQDWYRGQDQLAGPAVVTSYGHN